MADPTRMVDGTYRYNTDADCLEVIRDGVWNAVAVMEGHDLPLDTPTLQSTRPVILPYTLFPLPKDGIIDEAWIERHATLKPRRTGCECCDGVAVYDDPGHLAELRAKLADWSFDDPASNYPSPHVPGVTLSPVPQQVIKSQVSLNDVQNNGCASMDDTHLRNFGVGVATLLVVMTVVGTALILL